MISLRQLEICFVIAFLTFLIYSLYHAASIPTVHKSYATNGCVKVINYDENFSYTCENMPEVYNIDWVM